MKKYFLNGKTNESESHSLTDLQILGLQESDFVWFEGLDNWKPVGDIEELDPYIKKKVVPPPFQPKPITPPPSNLSSSATEQVIPPFFPHSSERDSQQIDIVNPLQPEKHEKITNTYLWLLAFAPLIGLILEGCIFLLTLNKLEMNDDSIVYEGNLWFITLFLNIGLSWLDERQLAKVGLNTSEFKGLIWLVPVYIYIRCKNTNSSLAPFVIWMIAFALGLLDY